MDMDRSTLQKIFTEPVDYDGAIFEILRYMGLLPFGTWDDLLSSGNKYITQSNCLLHDIAANILGQLERSGAIRSSEMKYVWNPDYDFEKVPHDPNSVKLYWEKDIS